MKLYECPRESYIKVDHDSTGTVYFFDHLDGMYSYCTDKYGNILHLAAYLDVIKVDKPENWDEKDG
jgi:hypothetical protein